MKFHYGRELFIEQPDRYDYYCSSIPQYQDEIFTAQVETPWNAYVVDESDHLLLIVEIAIRPDLRQWLSYDLLNKIPLKSICNISEIKLLSIVTLIQGHYSLFRCSQSLKQSIASMFNAIAASLLKVTNVEKLPCLAFPAKSSYIRASFQLP